MLLNDYEWMHEISEWIDRLISRDLFDYARILIKHFGFSDMKLITEINSCIENHKKEINKLENLIR